MSTTSVGDLVPRRPRRLARRTTRAWHWIRQLAEAEAHEDGAEAAAQEAVNLAIQWVKSEFSNVREHRPGDAVSLMWATAFQIALTAARIPGATLDHEPGLTEDEVQHLLNPWRAETAHSEEARS